VFGKKKLKGSEGEALNLATAPDRLRELLGSELPQIRVRAASNPSTPGDALASALDAWVQTVEQGQVDDQDPIRSARWGSTLGQLENWTNLRDTDLGYREDSPPMSLIIASQFFLVAAAATNPNCPEAALLQCAERSIGFCDFVVEWSMSERRGRPPNAVAQLAVDRLLEPAQHDTYAVRQIAEVLDRDDNHARLISLGVDLRGQRQAWIDRAACHHLGYAELKSWDGAEGYGYMQVVNLRNATADLRSRALMGLARLVERTEGEDWQQPDWEQAVAEDQDTPAQALLAVLREGSNEGALATALMRPDCPHDARVVALRRLALSSDPDTLTFVISHPDTPVELQSALIIKLSQERSAEKVEAAMQEMHNAIQSAPRPGVQRVAGFTWDMPTPFG